MAEAAASSSSAAPAKRPKDPTDPAERVAAAEIKREAGNEKFRTGDAQGATRFYEEAKKLLEQEYFVDVGDEGLRARLQACRMPTLLNLALCYLKADPPQGFNALEACEEVLFFDPENVKATYRKGKALVELQEFKEAEYELTKACKLSPSDVAIRQDLEALKRKMRGQLEQEKKTFEGLFDKAPGFASADREPPRLAEDGKASAASSGYAFIRNPEENHYCKSEAPAKEAKDALSSGRLEDAVFALEAALQLTASSGDWSSHFPLWLELGRLHMDLNVDMLAIRCFNTAAGVVRSGACGEPPSAPVRRNALLLRAICLLNEADEDALAEVSACLAAWLAACAGAPAAAGEDEPLDALLGRWRAAGGSGLLAADAAVAEGLLHLLNGREQAAQAFADALLAPADADSCFGPPCRSAAKWNMLGAVLANRGRHADALGVYDQALLHQPHYPRGLINRGIALTSVPDRRAAAAAFTAALELMPPWCSPMTWPLLKKAVQEQPGSDGSLAEAAGHESLARLRELLGPGAPESTGSPAAAADHLRSLGFA